MSEKNPPAGPASGSQLQDEFNKLADKIVAKVSDLTAKSDGPPLYPHHAQALANQFGFDWAVVCGPRGGILHLATWGRSAEDKALSARVADQVGYAVSHGQEQSRSRDFRLAVSAGVVMKAIGDAKAWLNDTTIAKAYPDDPEQLIRAIVEAAENHDPRQAGS